MKAGKSKAILVRIPSALHKKLKYKCVMDCRTMQEVLTEYIIFLCNEGEEDAKEKI